MASASSETTPLLPSDQQRPAVSPTAPKRPQRTVTFNPTVSSAPAPQSPPSPPAAPPRQAAQQRSQSHAPPVFATINSKLRRRHSHGALDQRPGAPQQPRAGAQRTTKTAQKLKLLPNPDHAADDEQEEDSGSPGREVYSQFTRIKDPSARRDAARLGKDDRERLPRVTAYCTASSYRMDDVMKFLKSRSKMRGAAPKLFDECVYSPWSYAAGGAGGQHQGSSGVVKTWDGSRREDIGTGVVEQDVHGMQQRTRRFSDSVMEVDGEAMMPGRDDLHPEEGLNRMRSNEAEQMDSDALTCNHAVMDPQDMHMQQHFQHQDAADTIDTQVHTPEVFLFNYGTVVIWGMTLKEEQRFLKDIAKFETEKLDKDDIQTENFNFYYTREYQARIYNDFISLREKRNYMTKLAISHALSQSVKTSLYEDLVDNTIESTKDIPAQIATTGKVDLSRKEINMQIGELFILRINIHLQGSVLDSPELMWAEPQLDPVYQAVRSYLEMDQRVSLLTERLDVIADLLAVLKDQLAHGHSETLEVIVIVLIAMEIVVAAVNIIVDLYAGVD